MTLQKADYSGNQGLWGEKMHLEAVVRLHEAATQFASAQSEEELQAQWIAAQQEFQNGWERSGNKVLFLIHDQESGISSEDVADLLGQLNSIEKRQPVDIVLHTRGGSASASDQIAAALVARKRTTAFVPIFANSGGTEIALAAELVRLGSGAELGSLDLRFAGWSARDLVRTAEELGDSAPADLKLLAKDAAKYLKDETKRVCARISRKHKGIFGWRGCELARILTSGDIPHGHGIGFKQAKKLHMNVRKGVPKSIYILLNLRRAQLARLRELRRPK